MSGLANSNTPKACGQGRYFRYASKGGDYTDAAGQDETVLEYLPYFKYRQGTKSDDDRIEHPIVITTNGKRVGAYFFGKEGPKKIFGFSSSSEGRGSSLSRDIEKIFRATFWCAKEDLLIEKQLFTLSAAPIMLGLTIQFEKEDPPEFKVPSRIDPLADGSRIHLKKSKETEAHLEIRQPKSGNDSQKGIRFRLQGNQGETNCQLSAEALDEGKYKGAVFLPQLLLDFLVDLSLAGDTGESGLNDRSLRELKESLLGNLYIDALVKKARYILKCQEHDKTFRNENNGKKLIKLTKKKTCKLDGSQVRAELDWLNVCRLDEYHSVFTSMNSIFHAPHVEVRQIAFREGACNQPRAWHERAITDENTYRSELSQLLLRFYDYPGALKACMGRGGLWGFWLIVFTMITTISALFLLGEHEFHEGVVSILLQVSVSLVLILFLLSLWKKDIVSLSLLRLQLGIVLGWVFLLATDEIQQGLFDLTRLPSLWVILISLALFSKFIYGGIHKYSARAIYGGTIREKVTELLSSFSRVIPIVAVAYLSSIFTGLLFLNMIGTKTENMKSGSIKESEAANICLKADCPTLEMDILNFFTYDMDYSYAIVFTYGSLAILMGLLLYLVFEEKPVTDPL